MNPSRKHVDRSVTRANFEKHWGDCEECGMPHGSLPDGHPLKKPLCPEGQKLYDRAVSAGGIKPAAPAAEPAAPDDPDAPGMKLLP